MDIPLSTYITQIRNGHGDDVAEFAERIANASVVIQFKAEILNILSKVVIDPIRLIDLLKVVEDQRRSNKYLRYVNIALMMYFSYLMGAAKSFIPSHSDIFAETKDGYIVLVRKDIRSQIKLLEAGIDSLRSFNTAKDFTYLYDIASTGDLQPLIYCKGVSAIKQLLEDSLNPFETEIVDNASIFLENIRVNRGDRVRTSYGDNLLLPDDGRTHRPYHGRAKGGVSPISLDMEPSPAPALSPDYSGLENLIDNLNALSPGSRLSRSPGSPGRGNPTCTCGSGGCKCGMITDDQIQYITDAHNEIAKSAPLVLNKQKELGKLDIQESVQVMGGGLMAKSDLYDAAYDLRGYIEMLVKASADIIKSVNEEHEASADEAARVISALDGYMSVLEDVYAISDRFKVFVRQRPVNPEIEGARGGLVIQVNEDSNEVALVLPDGRAEAASLDAFIQSKLCPKPNKAVWFSNFNKVFGPECATKEVFDKSLLESASEAIATESNTAIIALGPSGSGKTFTLIGNAGSPGIAPMIIRTMADNSAVERVEISAVQDYMGRAFDALEPVSDRVITVYRVASLTEIMGRLLVAHAATAAGTPDILNGLYNHDSILELIKVITARWTKKSPDAITLSINRGFTARGEWPDKGIDGVSVKIDKANRSIAVVTVSKKAAGLNEAAEILNDAIKNVNLIDPVKRMFSLQNNILQVRKCDAYLLKLFIMAWRKEVSLEEGVQIKIGDLNKVLTHVSKELKDKKKDTVNLVLPKYFIGSGTKLWGRDHEGNPYHLSSSGTGLKVSVSLPHARMTLADLKTFIGASPDKRLAVTELTYTAFASQFSSERSFGNLSTKSSARIEMSNLMNPHELNIRSICIYGDNKRNTSIGESIESNFKNIWDTVISRNRPVRSTAMNPESSRSHLFVYVNFFIKGSPEPIMVTLADLAGIENPDNYVGIARKEGEYIVKTLTGATPGDKGVFEKVLAANKANEPVDNIPKNMTVPANLMIKALYQRRRTNVNTFVNLAGYSSTEPNGYLIDMSGYSSSLTSLIQSSSVSGRVIDHTCSVDIKNGAKGFQKAANAV